MPDPAVEKATARSRFVNNRRALGNQERSARSLLAVRRLLDEPRLTSADTVAAYWPLGTEPDSRPLLGALLDRGARVLLPVLRPDRDLDWARYKGDAADLGPGGAGTRHPLGETLGVEAILDAQVVVVPALAVTAHGVRLGRGGGSYDRVLTRIAEAQSPPALSHRESARPSTPRPRTPRPWTCALLYDEELGTLEPGAVEPHDCPVDAACSDLRLVEFDCSDLRPV